MDFSSDHARWQAVCHRNPAAHASFIYAVKTTKIFCRPTCAARLARRANVVFFDTAAEASKAGFRSCKRCKPSSPDEPELEQRNQDIVRRACDIIRDLQGPINSRAVAKRIGLSTRYFHGIFKQGTGLTPAQYAASQRWHGNGLPLYPIDGFLEPLSSSLTPNTSSETESWSLASNGHNLSIELPMAACTRGFEVPLGGIGDGLDVCAADLDAMLQELAEMGDISSLPAPYMEEPPSRSVGASEASIQSAFWPVIGTVSKNYADQNGLPCIEPQEVRWRQT